MRQTRSGQARSGLAGIAPRRVSIFGPNYERFDYGRGALHLRLQCLIDMYIPMLTTHFSFRYCLLHLLHPHQSFSSLRPHQLTISIVAINNLFHTFTLYISTVLFLLARVLCDGFMSGTSTSVAVSAIYTCVVVVLIHNLVLVLVLVDPALSSVGHTNES